MCSILSISTAINLVPLFLSPANTCWLVLWFNQCVALSFFYKAQNTPYYAQHISYDLILVIAKRESKIRY